MSLSDISSFLPNGVLLAASLVAVVYSIVSAVRQYREAASQSIIIDAKLEALRSDSIARHREAQREIDSSRDELLDIKKSLDSYVKDLADEVGAKEAEIKLLRAEVERLRSENRKLAGGANGA
ncbi:hypothetical protein [Rhizobium sp. NLR22b]|uniref:hypothetical protein n=1 Tax=Rhizobium sp. NLR22b TaxID=2731115 RepID=UPI001C82A002|nr:hypothetical protein [Rhizobium sp. NLR22b]MBX5239189.1 hypothetical protein [Rhizobium sp. NLR22b]